MKPSDPAAIASLADLVRHGNDGGDNNNNGPVFAEPWQAHAFALALQLHERGFFDWSEWTAVLAAEIASARHSGEPDDGGAGYWRHWLNALEKLVLAKRLGTEQQIHRLEHAWASAAERTPHGQPIQLDDSDLLFKM